MDDYVTVESDDGFELRCFRSRPDRPPLGSIVVLHESYGLNQHIHSICRRLSAAGYTAAAPSLYDRLQPGFQAPYTPAGMEAAKVVALTLNWSDVRRDVEALVLAFEDTGRIGILGFCLGGTVAYAMACRLETVAATVSFYGGNIVNYLDKTPKCVSQLHFGRFDPHISMTDVEEIGRLRPDADLHVYEAGHGFNCDERDEFQAESAAIAWGRTIEFLRCHVAR